MGSLICTVELDKEKGVKVTIVDRDAEVTQSIAMDGATIVLSMKKGGEETSVTQTESSVTVRCKDFEVVAEAGMKIESSGVALLKGAIVNVQGSLVNVG